MNCYTRTRILFYISIVKNFYQELNEHPALKQHFDSTKNPDNHELYRSGQRMSTLKFKDEFAACPIIEFIRLKSKMYSLLCGCKQKLSAKRVTRFAQGSLKHELYCHVLLTGDSISTTYTRIGSKKHHLQTLSTKKPSFSAFHDRRSILEDGITCLPLAHKPIRDIAVFREKLEDEE